MTDKSDVEHRIAKYSQIIKNVVYDFESLMSKKGYSPADLKAKTNLREIKNELKRKYPSELVNSTVEMCK